MANASREQDQADPERAPLLPRDDDAEVAPPSESRVKKTAAWFARHAVLFFVTLLFIAVIVILVGFVKHSQNTKPASGETCLTPSCIHASSEILHNLDPNYKELDPCTDFRQLTCGGWDERHDLRPDQGDAFTGTIMEEESQTLLRHILEAPYPDESKHSSFSPAQLLQSSLSVDQENFNKLKSAYDACMNEDAIKKEGVKPLLQLLQSIVTMYPATPSSARGGEDIADAVDLLARLGVSALVALGTGADDKDPDVVVVQVAAPYTIGLPAKDYYKDESVVKNYESTVAEVLEALDKAKESHFDADAAWIKFDQIRNSAHAVVEFEKKLAAASPDPEDRDAVDNYYNPMSLKEADSLAPQIRLSAIIKRFTPTDVNVDRAIVMAPEYLKSLSNIISETPNEVIHTYFLWKVVQAYASAVEADELKPYSRFRNQIQGKDPESSPERWRTCVSHVDSTVGFILSRFFVEKAFSAKAKDLGDQIVSDIKEKFIEKLKVTSWMDSNVVELAIEKVHKIIQKIGYPTKSPDIMDPANLQKYYGSLDITSSFFNNYLDSNSFEFTREWAALGKPVDRDSWGMTVPTVNAYYNPPGNEIVFPAGIMQFPVFDVELPQYISYGAFGSVSGHELSHAFDSTGRHYDQNGNYTDWWTNSTVAGFQERADCFVNQYHNYSIPGTDGKPVHVNGKLTLGENIADAGGVSAAFAAWKKRRAETPNANLPGLEYFTQEQLFFISYGNWWCGKSRTETAVSRIYTDPHSPKFARILGTMANSRDFKESFNCPVKEPVCELW